MNVHSLSNRPMTRPNTDGDYRKGHRRLFIFSDRLALRSFPAHASLHGFPRRNEFLIAHGFANSSRVAGEVVVPVIRFRQFFWQGIFGNDLDFTPPFGGPPDSPDPIDFSLRLFFAEIVNLSHGIAIERGETEPERDVFDIAAGPSP